MLFNSHLYVFAFLPITLVVYYLCGTRKLRMVILLAASYCFYIWGNPYLILLILASSLTDYYVGQKLDQEKDANKRKYWLALSLFINLGLLFTFKYSAWVIESLNDWFLAVGMNAALPVPDLPLPPGISFYTFQTLSYTFDIYRRQFKPHKNLAEFLVYVAFFPQLIAGPIERSASLLPQLSGANSRFSIDNFKSGIFLIGWGLFKKLVFADNLSAVVEVGLDKLDNVPGFAFIIIFAFTFQIYCDFSAYTDIARGSARLFNIQLSRNFMTPYFATNPAEFWRRWHMTLSSWIRDYLYTPLFLRLNRLSSALRLITTLLLSMAIMGLWHGAAICYLWWGLYHGALLILYHFMPVDQWLKKRFGHFGQLSAWIIMSLLTMFGWMLFISTPSDRFFDLLRNMHLFFLEPVSVHFISWAKYTLCFSLPVIAADIAGRKYDCEFVDIHEKAGFKTRVFLYLLIIYGISLWGRRAGYDFIYFAF